MKVNTGWLRQQVISHHKLIVVLLLLAVLLQCILSMMISFSSFPPFVILTAISFGSVKIGLRHVLPVFPFIFVFTARFFKLALERSLLSGLAFLLIIWYLISSIRIYPHYLAYFNEYVGGPTNGYKYLVDSNLDWGQDLKGSKEYMERRDIEKVKLAYF